MKSVLIALLLVPAMLFGQQRQMISLELQKDLKTFAPEQQIALYLRGDISAMSTFVRSNNGKVKGSIRNILACSLPASKIAELNEVEGLDFVEIFGFKAPCSQ